MSVTSTNTGLVRSQSAVPAMSMASIPPPSNDIAVAQQTIRLYYQGPDGGIFQRKCVGGVCAAGTGQAPLWYALPGTPLAAVSWNNGLSTRVYYLDNNYKLQEACVFNDGTWIPGLLSRMEFQAAPNSSIAALRCSSRPTARYVSAFTSKAKAESDSIQELAYGSAADLWVRGETVSSVLSRTAIAATISV